MLLSLCGLLLIHATVEPVPAVLSPLFDKNTTGEQYSATMRQVITDHAFGDPNTHAAHFKAFNIDGQRKNVLPRLQEDNNFRTPHMLALKDGSKVPLIIGFFGTNIEHFEPMCLWAQYLETAETILAYYRSKPELQGRGCTISLCSATQAGQDTITSLIRAGWNFGGQANDSLTKTWVSASCTSEDSMIVGPQSLAPEKADEASKRVYLKITI